MEIEKKRKHKPKRKVTFEQLNNMISSCLRDLESKTEDYVEVYKLVKEKVIKGQAIPREEAVYLTDPPIHTKTLYFNDEQFSFLCAHSSWIILCSLIDIIHEALSKKLKGAELFIITKQKESLLENTYKHHLWYRLWEDHWFTYLEPGDPMYIEESDDVINKDEDEAWYDDDDSWLFNSK